jgi:hypothetical protein
MLQALASHCGGAESRSTCSGPRTLSIECRILFFGNWVSQRQETYGML